MHRLFPFVFWIFPSLVMASSWEFLLDEKLSKFESYTGVPHLTVDVDWDGKARDVYRDGKALGEGDPLGLFTVEKDLAEEWVLKVSGQTFGSLATLESYSSFHLKMEVKWGSKRWLPKLHDASDSGIIYHSTGPFGGTWKTWKQGLEFQLEEGNMGDFFVVGAVKAEAPLTETSTPGLYRYHQPATWRILRIPKIRAQRGRDVEKEKEWNRVEIIAHESQALHLLNGKVVNVIRNAEVLKNDLWRPLTGGQIQFQSAGSEVSFRKLRIKRTKRMSPLFRRLFK